ncbi:uncharacterized protein N7482_009192 [Penicillium canariense]|uniref:Uncharacterized protein n=1 Tax=Penicillium canariense TaxID=189055 RepID=A0A9W9HSL8_9EURO|nr:uncharacterized protein N7482_009192 [Penicillium canariense]KAJ5152714.1 hypothetical protein N7482_009192 [Penicillium canariense]
MSTSRNTYHQPSAAELLRLMYPDAHPNPMQDLEERLTEVDSSLLSLIVFETAGEDEYDAAQQADNALKAFFEYVQAGRAFNNALKSAPLGQRIA